MTPMRLYYVSGGGNVNYRKPLKSLEMLDEP
jgi:hypothetical protein